MLKESWYREVHVAACFTMMHSVSLSMLMHRSVFQLSTSPNRRQQKQRERKRPTRPRPHSPLLPPFRLSLYPHSSLFSNHLLHIYIPTLTPSPRTGTARHPVPQLVLVQLSREMAKGGRRKCGSGDILRAPSVCPDGSQIKESPSKDLPTVCPQLKAPLVRERPLEGPSTNAYSFGASQGKEEEPDAATVAARRRPFLKDTRQPPGDPAGRPYFGPPRDRGVRTERYHIPASPPIDEQAASSRHELLRVGSLGGYVLPTREAAPHERHRIQTSSGRLYAPHPHRPLEAGFFGGPEAIKQLERKWSGLHSRDSRQSPSLPTPPPPDARQFTKTL